MHEQDQRRDKTVQHRHVEVKRMMEVHTLMAVMRVSELAALPATALAPTDIMAAPTCRLIE